MMELKKMTHSETAIDILSKVLNIEKNTIKLSVIGGGMTNRNFLLRTTKGSYVVRIPGEGTGNFINRREERKNTYNAVKCGWHPDVIYFDDSGIKITEYIENSEILSAKFLKDENVLNNVIGILKKLHLKNFEVNNMNENWICNEYKKYDAMLDKEKVKWNLYPAFRELEKEFLPFVEKLKSFNPQFSACHNDLVPQNWIISKDNLYLLDWEYSAINDPAFDLASLVSEFKLDKNLRNKVITLYSKDEFFEKRVYIYELLQHILWFVWTLVKEQHGVFFGSYGKDRLKKAYSMWRICK